MSLRGRLILLVVGIACCIAWWPVSAMAQAVPAPSFGGGVAYEYTYYDTSNVTNNRRGGNWGMGYFILNVKDQAAPAGQPVNSWEYGAEYRWLSSASNNFLHYGQVAYNFGCDKSSQLILGYFQVPFGNLRLGYDSWYGPLTYYVGFQDNQAMGVGYKHEAGPWRFDLDFYKNDTAKQASTYGTNAGGDQPYDSENSGNMRIAYSCGKGQPNNATFSASIRGGQMFGNSGNFMADGLFPIQDSVGTRWAANLAMDANWGGPWGPWNLKVALIHYEYNLPNSSNMTAADRGTMIMENFGFDSEIPAKADLVQVSLEHPYKVTCLGPISSITPYLEYSYLHVPSTVDYVGGNGVSAAPIFGSGTGQRVGEEQLFDPGIKLNAGPLYVYIDGLISRNASGTAFLGSDNGKWNTGIFAVTAFYF